MPKEHARAGVAHHHPDLLPPHTLIAMDGTIGACGFFRSKPAALQSHPGVIEQLLALRAKVGGRIVLVPAFAGEPFVGESSRQDFWGDWRHDRRCNVFQSRIHDPIIAERPVSGFDFGQGFDESAFGDECDFSFDLFENRVRF